MYDAAMDRITRWVPELKDTFEGATATHGGACRGCEIDGVHVECSFSTRVPGGKAIPHANLNTSCLICSEARLKTLGKRSISMIAHSLKTFHAWREEHPVVYDAVMDRITRWVPELKNHFERAAAGENVKHKPPASLEERAAADKQQREEQWASAKASRRRRERARAAAKYKPRKCASESM